MFKVAMKIILISLSMLLLFGCIASTFTPSGDYFQTEMAKPVSRHAVVILYSGQLEDSKLQDVSKISINGKPYGSIVPGGFIKITLAPGVYHFNVTHYVPMIIGKPREYPANETVTLSSNTVYYLQYKLKTRANTNVVPIGNVMQVESYWSIVGRKLRLVPEAIATAGLSTCREIK